MAGTTAKDRQRFWSKAHASSSGCWLWTAYVDATGYGRFKIAGVVRRAHQVAYELMHGPIPDGKVVDHLCRNRRCVNPEHLEAVTAHENTLRGVGPSAQNASKERCACGRPYTHRWISTTQKRQRVCQPCKNRYERARRTRSKT